jgi:hypothetical protein
LAKNRRLEAAEKLVNKSRDFGVYYHTECSFDSSLIWWHPLITGKIADFGLSSILGSKFYAANSKANDAIKWRVPELALCGDDDVEGRGKLLDVWSFALTSLEVRSSLYF